MHIANLIELMEEIAPPDLAEEFDEGRIGLIIEGNTEIERVCCALDVTPEVITRAISLGADALVAHHTPFWDPLTRITGRDARLLRSALAAGLNVYVMHTNFDLAPGGVNDVLAEMLCLEAIETMSLGVVGDCSKSFEDITRILGGNIRIHGRITQPGRLAVIGGSGFTPDLIEEAVVHGADAFLSAELKHSVAIASPLPLIESTHYALEAPAMRHLAERMDWDFIDDPPYILLVQ